MIIPNIFLFVATYADGSQIIQNEDDASETTAGKNCYYDVLSRVDKPVSFVITDGDKVFGVDLSDGHFEVNGVPFFQHRPELEPLSDFDLVYCRTPEQTIDARSGKHISGRIAGYTIGWQTEKDGIYVKRTLSIYLD